MPETAPTETPRARRSRRLPRAFLIIAGLFVLLLPVLWLLAGPVAGWYAERRLNGTLGTAVEIGSARLLLRPAGAMVRDIQVASPEGTADAPLLTAGEVFLGPRGILDVREVTLFVSATGGGPSNFQGLTLQETGEEDAAGKDESGESSSGTREETRGSAAPALNDIRLAEITATFRRLRNDGGRPAARFDLPEARILLHENNRAEAVFVRPQFTAFSEPAESFFAAAEEIAFQTDDREGDRRLRALRLIAPDFRIAWNREGEDSLDSAGEFIRELLGMEDEDDENEEEENGQEDKEDDRDEDRRRAPLPELDLRNGYVELTVAAPDEGFSVQGFTRINASVVRDSEVPFVMTADARTDTAEEPALRFLFEGEDPLAENPEGETWEWSLEFNGFPWHVTKWPDRWDDDDPATLLLRRAMLEGRLAGRYDGETFRGVGRLRWSEVDFDPDTRSLMERLRGTGRDEAASLRALADPESGETPWVEFTVEETMADPNLFFVQVFMREAWQRAVLEAAGN